MSDDKRKKRPPLTEAQRATVTQWYPLAVRYTYKALNRRGLSRFADEAPGLASEAVVLAAYAWVPSRGSFASCLKWWVKSVVDKFNCHGARTVQQSEHAREYMDAWSLNAPLGRRWVGKATGATGDVMGADTWGDLLADSSAVTDSDSVDAARLSRAAEVVVTRRLEEEYRLGLPEGAAQEFYRVWLDRVIDGDDTPMHFIGWAWGVSRQMAHQRLERVQRVFDAWAREVREEAA